MNGWTRIFRQNSTHARYVDVTDPHRNFTAAEWDKLGTMRSFVLQIHDGGGDRAGRRSTDNRSTTSTTNQTTSAPVSATDDNNNNNNSNDASVVSEITERGSQNGRSFGRGAYNNNNN